MEQEDWETPCPVMYDGKHCWHWYDGEACHGCGAPAATPEEMSE